MYIEITPTDYIVSFRRQTDKPTAFNVDYHYSEDPDYQSGIIDFTQLKQDLVVTVRLENGVWTADHTWADMQQAIANGVLVRLTDETNDRYAIMGGYEDDKLIFVTNDTDYCYAYIVTDADAWTMEEVLEGEDGVGIASVTFNPDYTLTLTLTNGNTYTSQSLRGAQGPAGQDGEDGAQGPEGPEGPEGPQGVGIASTVLNADYTLTITLTNGNSYTTPSIRGAQGPAGQDGRDGVDGADGADGADGVGIASTVLNADYTLTITLTDGNSYTTPSIRGATGATGPAGPGVPTGGTTGQILAKVDNTDYNTQWVTPPPEEVFWATYGSTTFAEVMSAVNADKVAFVYYDDAIYRLAYIGDGAENLVFAYVNYATVNYLELNPNDTWSYGNIQLQDTSYKKSSWSATPNNFNYPSEKLVKDSIDAVRPRIYVGTCGTAAATVKKVVSVETFPTDSNGKPIKGTMIAVKFTNSNSANAPTLNVNSTGDIGIWYNNATATSSSAIYGGYANRYNFYIYDGTYWVWMSYGTDANDNTIGYTIRTNGLRKTVNGACYRYRILFNSADGTQWVPANTSSSTNATSTRTTNQTKIDPFGPIVYYSSTTALSNGGAPAASALMQQYNGITLGYSFNRTGAALTLTSQKPVYIKCAPQTGGSAIIDADNPYVQDLPTTADGKIYILLGVATAATTIEMIFTHPIYYYSNGAIREWTNSEPGGVTDVTVGGTSVVSGGVAVVPAIPAAGIPSGGATGQVLAKVDGTDYNAEWTTPSGGPGDFTLLATVDCSTLSGGDRVTITDANGLTEIFVVFERLIGSTSTASAFHLMDYNTLTDMYYGQPIPYTANNNANGYSGWAHIWYDGFLRWERTAGANSPTNYSLGAINGPYCVNTATYGLGKITKLAFWVNQTYPVASGTLKIYGR